MMALDKLFYLLPHLVLVCTITIDHTQESHSI